MAVADDDLLQWAQDSPGVGEAGGADLIAMAQVRPPALKPSRSRPNRGRRKCTNRNPPLSEPPLDILRETGYPIPPGLECLPYTPTNWRSGERYMRWKRAVLAMWGTTCHLCGHPNAHTADHLVPVSVWPNQPYDARLGRAAHGVEGCPTCGIKCNSSRGNKQLAIEIGQYKPPITL